MSRGDVTVSESIRRLDSRLQGLRGFTRKRHFDGGRDSLRARNPLFDFRANSLSNPDNRLPGNSGDQRAMFPQHPQQQMLGLDEAAAVLAGLVARKEDDAARLLCVSLKHDYGGSLWSPTKSCNRSLRRITRSFLAGHGSNQHAQQETTDVRPHGDASGGGH